MRMIVSTVALLLATPALADEGSFPVDYKNCLGAIRAAAQQRNLPLQFAVINQNVAVFNIPTSGGTVTMRCARMAGTLTVTTPAGQSILPYVSSGAQ